MTAGVAATRALLPLSYALSPLDTIVSAHSLSTAYGRAIAYTAIFEGTSLATLDSSKLFRPEERESCKRFFLNMVTASDVYGFEDPVDIDVSDAVSYKAYSIPSPTVLFLKPGHLESTVSSIVKQASRSFILYPFARRHKLASLREGYVSKESLWDRLVFDSARAKVIGDGAGTVRGVIISGGECKS